MPSASATSASCARSSPASACTRTCWRPASPDAGRGRCADALPRALRATCWARAWPTWRRWGRSRRWSARRWSIPGGHAAAAARRCAETARRCRIAADDVRAGGPGARTAARSWAVPLWSERGLIGVLLLGDKRDGGLYTQEEIEIARASGERLIDTQASAALAQRLMALAAPAPGREPGARPPARRVLHDDVLPHLHTAMLVAQRNGASSNGEAWRCSATCTARSRTCCTRCRRRRAGRGPPGAAGRAAAGAGRRVGRRVRRRDLARSTPEAERAAPALPPPIGRGAVLRGARGDPQRGALWPHGDGARPLHLRVGVAWRDGLEIARLRTTAWGWRRRPARRSGSGHGLALHSTMMAVVGGTLATDSVPGQYTRVTLTLPQQTWG